MPRFSTLLAYGMSDFDTAVIYESGWPRPPQGIDASPYYRAGITSASNDIARLEAARKNVRRRKTRIQQLEADGKNSAANQKRSLLCRSSAAALVAAHRAIKSCQFRLGQRPPRAAELVDYMAANPQIDEDVFLRMRRKESGAARPIFAFGLVDKAKQYRFDLAYRSKVAFDTSQYGCPGRGALAAVQAVAKLISDPQYGYVAELDIRDCFGNVRATEAIRHLFGPAAAQLDVPLTFDRKENAGKIRLRNCREETLWETTRNSMPTGCTLPQGATTSPLIAYGLLWPALEEFRRLYTDQVVATVCCDNFLVIGRTKAEMEGAIESLNGLLAAIPASSFTLKVVTAIRPVSQGIDYLGFRLRRRRHCTIVAMKNEKKREVREAIRSAVTSMRGAHPDSQEITIEIFDRWLCRRWGQIKLAPNDAFELLQAVFFAFKHYGHTASGANLLRRVAKWLPEEEACTKNPVGSVSPRPLVNWLKRATALLRRWPSIMSDQLRGQIVQARVALSHLGIEVGQHPRSTPRPISEVLMRRRPLAAIQPAADVVVCTRPANQSFRSVSDVVMRQSPAANYQDAADVISQELTPPIVSQPAMDVVMRKRPHPVKTTLQPVVDVVMRRRPARTG